MEIDRYEAADLKSPQQPIVLRGVGEMEEEFLHILHISMVSFDGFPSPISLKKQGGAGAETAPLLS